MLSHVLCTYAGKKDCTTNPEALQGSYPMLESQLTDTD